MKTTRFLTFFWLALLGVTLILSSPAMADAPKADDVREILEKAWNPSGDAPSNADRTDMLKQAMKLLKSMTVGYHGHRMKAMKFIDSALYELDKGDPDHKVTDLIHSAVSEVRDMT
jgi:hypothetical protein